MEIGIHYSGQDNLHYPLTDASLPRAMKKNESWERKGMVYLSHVIFSKLMSFNTRWVFLPSTSFRKIILVRLSKGDFATSLTWPQITTLNIPLPASTWLNTFQLSVKGSFTLIPRTRTCLADTSVSLLCSYLL